MKSGVNKQGSLERGLEHATHVSIGGSSTGELIPALCRFQELVAPRWSPTARDCGADYQVMESVVIKGKLPAEQVTGIDLIIKRKLHDSGGVLLAGVRQSFDSVLRCVPIQSAHGLGLLLITGSEVGSLVAALFSF